MKEGEGEVKGCPHEEEKIIPDNMGKFQKECLECGRRRKITDNEYLLWGEA